MGELSGQMAVVTGGSQGIGRAAVERLAEGGAAVAFCGMEDKGVRETQDSLVACGHTVLGMVGDVRREDQLRQMVRGAVELFGGVDILVSCAGIQAYGSVVDTPESLWDEVLDVNLKGAYLAARVCVPEMRQRGGGSIVIVASVQAYASQANVAAYAASKAGLLGLARSMALDHAGEKIRVNTVCPGSVDTPMLRRAAARLATDGDVEGVLARWGAMHPLGRVATAAEVAEVVAFLAGPRASFVTGAEVRVDGGMLARLGVELTENDARGEKGAGSVRPDDR